VKTKAAGMNFSWADWAGRMNGSWTDWALKAPLKIGLKKYLGCFILSEVGWPPARGLLLHTLFSDLRV